MCRGVPAEAGSWFISRSTRSRSSWKRGSRATYETSATTEPERSKYVSGTVRILSRPSLCCSEVTRRAEVAASALLVLFEKDLEHARGLIDANSGNGQPGWWRSSASDTGGFRRGSVWHGLPTLRASDAGTVYSPV